MFCFFLQNHQPTITLIKRRLHWMQIPNYAMSTLCMFSFLFCLRKIVSSNVTRVIPFDFKWYILRETFSIISFRFCLFLQSIKYRYLYLNVQTPMLKAYNTSPSYTDIVCNFSNQILSTRAYDLGLLCVFYSVGGVCECFD